MIDHDAIGKVMFKDTGDPIQPMRCVGKEPNPYLNLCKEYVRRDKNRELIDLITREIYKLYQPRFITSPEVSELIEGLVTNSDARNILELGSYSGFTTLHMIRAIVGKEAKVTGVDCNPAHDPEFFSRPEIKKYLRMVNGRTPECLAEFHGETFDLVFIDSDHTVEHCQKERAALEQLTKPGCIWLFHDVPTWRTPDNRTLPPVRIWLNSLVKDGFLSGLCFPTPEQADCLETYGAGYPPQVNPHLGVFIRN